MQHVTVAIETVKLIEETVSSWSPDVLLVNPIKGAPGDEFSSRKYAETVPPLYLLGHFHSNWPAEPVYFNMLSAHLRSRGVVCETVDGFCHAFNSDEMLSVIRLFAPKIVAFAVFYNTLPDTLDCIQQLKREFPDVVTVLGSAFASPHWRNIVSKPGVDYVVVGDGEVALSELATQILSGRGVAEVSGVARMGDSGAVLTPPQPLTDLDALPFGSRDLLPIVKRLGHGVSIYTSRGCAFGKCSFCYLVPYQDVALQPLWRYRSASNVVDEIQSLVEDLDIRSFTFCDEDYFGDRGTGIPRAVDIAQQLIDRGLSVRYYVNALARSILALARADWIPMLAQSGLDSVFIGFESASTEALIGFRKPQRPTQYDEIIDVLHGNGIKINPGLITFTPNSTIDAVRRNIDLARSVRYYDLFLFTRRLVDLAEMATNSFVEPVPSAPARRQEKMPTWLLDMYRSHERDMDWFIDPRVGIAWQTLRLLSHHLYDHYFSECISDPERVKDARSSLIGRHYEVCNRLLTWAALTEATTSFEAMNVRAQEAARWIILGLSGETSPLADNAWS